MLLTESSRLSLSLSQEGHEVQTPTPGPPQRHGSTSQKREGGWPLHLCSGLGPTTHRQRSMGRSMSLEVRNCMRLKQNALFFLYSTLSELVIIFFRNNGRPRWSRTLRPLQQQLGLDVPRLKIRDEFHCHSMSREALRDWLLCSQVQCFDHAVLQPCHR